MEKKTTSNHKRQIWNNKNQRIMLTVILVGVIIFAVIFSLLGVYMSRNSNDTIDQTGETYMLSMGYQTTQRFNTVINQRISMVQALVEEYSVVNITSTISVNDNMTEDDVRNSMSMSAQLRGFEFLALYSVENKDDIENGSTVDMLLGNNLEVTDRLPFRDSVIKGEKKIAVGSGETSDGTIDINIVIISIPTDKFNMRDKDGNSLNRKSMSLIAGITNKDFMDMLSFNEAPDIMATDSFIVRKDEDPNSDNKNSFVLKRKDVEFGYFSEYLHSEFADTEINTHIILDELNEKMQLNTSYSNILHLDGHHIHMYCNRLDMSEWYLITIMDNAHLDTIIEDLSNQWTIMIVIAVVIIVVILLGIFLLYMHFNKQNIAQLQLARTEALEASKAKSEFLSNMSHDIRTPMNAIVGMTAIARANIEDQQHVSDCLKKIALSSKHLLGLINDVLDMSKIESGKMTLNMEQISIREVLDSITTIVQPQMKTKRQKFNLSVNNIKQENVYCDSVRLNQVLLNLLSNAIKFTAEEGTISMSLTQEDSPIGEDYIRTHIYVKDNGIGMSEEFQKKIFESFTREDSMRVHRTEGTGLGMTITKYIVDAMKGTIELHSEVGKGTEFHIALDLEKALIPDEEMILPNWKMLIVDDDEQLCETTIASLKEIGIDAEWTLDGESAVEKAVKAHDRNMSYDVILMDWKLPGIDGLETAKQIRNRLGENEVPILLISAYDWGEIEEQARAVGICGFINKPLFKSTLYYGLKQFIGETDKNKSDDASPKKINLEGTHVLVAEDNDINWEIAEVLLDSIGIKCDHAENGQICVDMLKNSEAGTYQAILMDIRMPIMTGYDATIAIRKLDHPDKDLPIIAMTADAFADDMKKCLECGMQAHIAKPIDIDTVQQTLAKFLKK